MLNSESVALSQDSRVIYPELKCYIQMEAPLHLQLTCQNWIRILTYSNTLKNIITIIPGSKYRHLCGILLCPLISISSCTIFIFKYSSIQFLLHSIIILSFTLVYIFSHLGSWKCWLISLLHSAFCFQICLSRNQIWSRGFPT